MGEEKNIRLTLVQPQDDEGETIQIDFSLIFSYVKRLFVLWLALSVALGSVSAAWLARKRGTAVQEDISALISIPQSAGEDVINQLKSPTVVEEAMNAMDMDLTTLDLVRSSVLLSGVIPDASQDRMNLYYQVVLSGTTGAATDAVERMLNTDIHYTQYVVTFSYIDVGLSQTNGIAFLNELLQAYRRYYDANYNRNRALGTSLSLIDYRDYDYAEAVDIISDTISEITRYINSVSDLDFRSARTGYSFRELLRTIGILRDVELDRVSSFITVNGVTSYSLDYAVRRYEWLIENRTRQRAVQETRLNSLIDSIASYEKTPVIYTTREGDTVLASETDLNTNYDAMVQERLSVQETISNYNRTIRYYQSFIDRFTEQGAAGREGEEKVQEYLASLNTKLNQLIQDLSDTADEYYTKAAFADTVQILVPASVSESTGSLRRQLLICICAEMLLFCCVGAAAVTLGMREANPPVSRKKPEPAGV